MTYHNHRRGTRGRLPRHIEADVAASAAFKAWPTFAWRVPWLRRPFAAKAQLADVSVIAGMYGYVYDGHRGRARATRGAKTSVHSCTRFHDEAATRRLAAAAGDER